MRVYRAGFGVVASGAIGAIGAVAGCGGRDVDAQEVDASVEDASPAASAAASGPRAHLASSEARVAIAALRSHATRAVYSSLDLDRVEAPARVPVIEEGLAIALEALPSGRLRPTFDAKAKATPRAAAVELAARADQPTRLEDVRSRRAVSFALVGARPVDAELVDGVVVYRGAFAGGDLVHRPRPDGTEDFLTIGSRPADESARWSVDVRGIAGLRAMGNTVELLQDDGLPVLRVTSPYVVDADGARHEATLSIEGCAYDRDPLPPRGRAVTAPGSERCEVVVDWSPARLLDAPGARLAYPIVVDPLWSTTGSMAAARKGFTATAMSLGISNGIVVVGGNDGTNVLSSAEFYDGGTFSALNSMPLARDWHTATILATNSFGDLLVAGGRTNVATNAVTGVTHQLTTAGTWLTKPSMNYARGFHTADRLFGASGVVFVVGGLGSPGTSEWFDPAGSSGAGLWSVRAAVPTARRQHTSSFLAGFGGHVLVAGGNNGAVVGNADRYDPGSGTWSVTAIPMLNARFRHAATTLSDGLVLISGGNNGSGTIAATEYFNPSNNTFFALAAMGTTRELHTLTTLANDRVLAVGGGLPGTTYSGTAEVWIRPTNTWVSAGSLLNGARGEQSATPLSTTSVLIAGGGANNVTAMKSAELFNLLANGEACSDARLCTSQVCADGVCCDSACSGLCQACTAALKGTGASGTCGAILNGLDPQSECTDQGAASCANNGSCNGAGACAKYATGTVCVAASCTGTTLAKQSTCSGTCVSGGTQDCTPYVCGTGACKTSCATDADCTASGYCGAGTCKLDQAAGAACTAASQCQSGFCVDGVCCDSACAGTCQACTAALKGTGSNGNCAAIVNGSDPQGECADQGAASCGTNGSCNGASACAKYATGTGCAAASCSGTTPGLLTKASTCNGTCVSGGTQDCTPYACAAGACKASCASDLDCTANAYCGAGTCKLDLATGAACTSTSQCQSGFCADGVCCDKACGGLCEACTATLKGSGASGACGPIGSGLDPQSECADQGPPTCGTNGVCNGARACAKYATGTVCAPAACSATTPGLLTNASTCNGTCLPGGSADCSPFQCAAGACKTTCTADTDCTTNGYCDGATGKCKADQATGAVCTAASQCLSGFCVDGVCCNAACGANCQACSNALTGAVNGQCADVKSGTDPKSQCAADPQSGCQHDGTCDAGKCRLYGPTTSCGTGALCTGTTASGQFCDGFGTCRPAGAPVACETGYVCKTGVGCLSTCVDFGDCLAGFVCQAGKCVGKGPNGTACTDASTCASGFCADGVCCDRACGGQCEACDTPTATGACIPVTGAPHAPRAACDAGTSGEPCTARACDGADRSACAGYVGSAVVCRAASCTTGVASATGKCAEGKCAVTTTKCDPFVCAGDVCGTTCAADADCAAKFRCDLATHDCVPRDAAVCTSDGLSVRDPAGNEKPCAPYVCEGGACKSTCSVTSDCAPGGTCDPVTSHCLAGAASGSEGGCACDVPGTTSPRSLAPMAAIASLLVLGARRRASRRRRG